jgi:hypothetical protein
MGGGPNGMRSLHGGNCEKNIAKDQVQHNIEGLSGVLRINRFLPQKSTLMEFQNNTWANGLSAGCGAEASPLAGWPG